MDSIRIFLSTSIAFINLGLALLYFCLIRIFVDIQIIGYYVIINSFFLTFVFICRLGFGVIHIKVFSETQNIDEQSMYNGLFLLIRLIQFITYIIFMLILILIVPIYKGDFLIVFFLLLANIFRIGRMLFIPLFYPKKQIVKIFLPEMVFYALEIILFLTFMNFMIIDLWCLVIILFTANLIGFIIHLFLIRNFKFKTPKKNKLKYLILSIPFFIMTSLEIILKNIDILILYTYVPIEDIVNYDTAKIFFSVFVIVISIVDLLLLSTFSKNIENGNIEKNLKIIKKLHKILNLFFNLFFFFILLYSTPILVLIFGSKYKLAGIILTILSINLILISINLGAGIQLKAIGKLNLLAILAIIRFLIQIILLIIFISPSLLNMGVIGAAISIVLTSVIFEIITRPYFYIKFNIDFYFGSFINLGIILGIFIFHLFLNSLYTFPIYTIPIFILLYLFIYFVLGYFFKSYNKEDIKLILKTINLKNIIENITEELSTF